LSGAYLPNRKKINTAPTCDSTKRTHIMANPLKKEMWRIAGTAYQREMDDKVNDHGHGSWLYFAPKRGVL
jgi:hypothetical protein